MPWQLFRIMIVTLLLLTMQHSIAQQSAPTETTKSSQDVLVVVNGTKLTKMHFDQFVRLYYSGDKKWAQENKGQVMRQLVLQEFFAQEAKRLQLDQHPEIQMQFYLQNNNLLSRLMVDKSVKEKSGVTKDAVRNYYDANQTDFLDGETITVSHILVKTETEAHEVLKELEEGKDFAEVAKARSISASRADGGQIGKITRGRADPAFEKAAFALKVGEVSAPVKTKRGYHIITVTKRIEPRPKPFNKVKETIRQNMVDTYIKSLVQNVLGKASIEIKNTDYQFK